MFVACNYEMRRADEGEKWWNKRKKWSRIAPRTFSFSYLIWHFSAAPLRCVNLNIRCAILIERWIRLIVACSLWSRCGVFFFFFFGGSSHFLQPWVKMDQDGRMRSDRQLTDYCSSPSFQITAYNDSKQQKYTKFKLRQICTIIYFFKWTLLLLLFVLFNHLISFLSIYCILVTEECL